MPTEDRRIYFDYEEVYRAIFALCALREMKKPPPGLIKEITVDKEDDAKLTFAVQNPQENTGKDLEFSRDFLAAALMVYCRGCGIPLPKSAKKSVELGKGNVVLRVRI